MTQVKVKLLRPLNGAEVGSEAEYDKADADRLASTGAVKILGGGKAAEASPVTKMEAPLLNKAAAPLTTDKAQTGASRVTGKKG